MDTPFRSLDDHSLEQTVRHYEVLIRGQRAGLEEYELYVLCLREWVRRKAEHRSVAASLPTATSVAAVVTAAVFRVAGLGS